MSNNAQQQYNPFKPFYDAISDLKEQINQLGQKLEEKKQKLSKDDVLTREEFCEKFNISHKVWRTWKQDGCIKVYGKGQCEFILLSEFLNSRNEILK